MLQYLEDSPLSFVLSFRSHLVQLSRVAGVNTKAQKSQVTLSTGISGWSKNRTRGMTSLSRKIWLGMIMVSTRKQATKCLLCEHDIYMYAENICVQRCLSM